MCSKIDKQVFFGTVARQAPVNSGLLPDCLLLQPKEAQRKARSGLSLVTGAHEPRPMLRGRSMSIHAAMMRVALGFAVLMGATSAQAQDYPSRPVRLILPYNPGGIVDYVGRTIGQGLAQASGQSVVPENKPGAGGILGTHTVATSDPDGYTLLLMDPAIVVNSVLQADINYDLFKDLKVVSVVSSSPLVLVVTPSLPATSFKEFLDYAKANPAKLNYASAGVGTTPHLAGELLRMRTGIDATHVPYRGIAGSFADLMTAKVQFSFSSIPGARPFTDDNRLRALATTG